MSAAAIRRGWCPGVRRPMATGDGLLVRLHPVDGAFTSLQARVIAHGARECGNGLLDLSTRGNLQIRGVRENTQDSLLGLLVDAGLAAPEQDRPNLTICSPLAGLDPTDHLDARDVARRVEDRASGIDGLSPKTAVVIDGGGALALDSGEADVALLAFDSTGSPAWALALASREGPVWIGATGSDGAVSAVAGILETYARLLQGGQHQRVRDLPAASWLALLANVPLAPAPAGLPARAFGARVGWAELGRDRLALLAAAPFGRIDAAGLDVAAEWSENFGDGALRLSPWRGFAIAGVARRNAPTLTRLAEAAGLIVDPADPRLAIAACAGLPACASATTPTRRDAARLAEIAAPLIAAGATLHVSGCAKGCAQAKPASLTLIGHNGAYGIVLDGTSKDLPRDRFGIEAVAARLSEARAPGDLAQVFA